MNLQFAICWMQYLSWGYLKETYHEDELKKNKCCLQNNNWIMTFFLCQMFNYLYSNTHQMKIALSPCLYVQQYL